MAQLLGEWSCAIVSYHCHDSLLKSIENMSENSKAVNDVEPKPKNIDFEVNDIERHLETQNPQSSKIPSGDEIANLKNRPTVEKYEKDWKDSKLIDSSCCGSTPSNTCRLPRRKKFHNPK